MFVMSVARIWLRRKLFLPISFSYRAYSEDPISVAIELTQKVHNLDLLFSTLKENTAIAMIVLKTV